MNLPVQWKNIPGKDNSWNLYFQSLTWLKYLINSTNQDSVFTGFRIINEWISEHDFYPNSDEPFAYSDHATSYRLGILVKAYKKYKSMGIRQPDFERRIRLSILSHIFLMVSAEKYMPYHNHGIIMDNSLIRALHELPEFNRQKEFIDFAYKRMFEVYRYSFTSEGLHKEHSPCYHYQFANMLKSSLDLADTLKIIIPEDVQKISLLSNDYIEYMNWNGNYPPVGDCARNRPIPKSKSTLQNSSYFHVFPQSGWVYVSDTVENIKIVSQCNYYSNTHYQEHETSFLLNVNGNELIVDPGLYSYTKSPLNSYMNEAKSHNVLVVNDQNFNSQYLQTGLSGVTRFYIDSANYPSSAGIVEMTHPHYEKLGVKLYRQLASFNHNSLTVMDSMISEKSNTYSQRFHFAPGASVKEQKYGLIMRWKRHPYVLFIQTNADDFEFIDENKTSNRNRAWYFSQFNEALPGSVLILNRIGSNVNVLTSINVYNNQKIHLTEDIFSNTASYSEDYGKLKSGLDKIKQKTFIQESRPNRWTPVR